MASTAVVGSLMAGDSAFRRDVDQDAEREQRVLLHRPLGRRRPPSPASRRSSIATAPPCSTNSGSSLRDEVADLRHELDHAVARRGLAHQRLEIDRQHDFRSAADVERSGVAHLAGGRAVATDVGRLTRLVRIDRLDDRRALRRRRGREC